MILRKLIITLSLIISNTIFPVSSRADESNRTIPGLPCKIDPLKATGLKNLKWTRQEHWVWKQVCVGKEANLNDYIKENNFDNYNDNFPLETKEIDESRILTSEFLKTILLYEPFRSALTEQGVIISGGWFQKTLDLYSVNFNEDLILDDFRFDNGADLGNIHSQVLISLDGSYFKGKEFSINSGVIGTSLFMRNATFETDIVDLIDVEVNNNLVLDGSSFKGKEFSINSGVIGTSLLINNATFETDIVDFTGVEVDNDLMLDSSSFKGKEFSINSGVIGTSLFMRKATFETDVIDFNGVEVDNNLQLNDSSFKGKDFSISSGTIGIDLLIDNATFETDVVDFTGIEVDNNLQLNDSSFKGKDFSINSGAIGTNLFIINTTFETDVVDFIGIKIDNNLQLIGSSFKGKEFSINSGSIDTHLFMTNATFETDVVDLTALKANSILLGDLNISKLLDLRNAEVNSFEIYNSIPIIDLVDIINFTYNQLNNNSIKFLKNTLDKLEYTPQPYEQFAIVTRRIGLQHDAETMLFNSKDKELMQELRNKNLARVLGLFIQRSVIGYGYKIENSFYISLFVFGIGLYLKIREKKLAEKLSIELLINTINPVILLPLIIKLNHLNLASILILREFQIGNLRSFLYTLDTLLPVIALDKIHEDMAILKSTQNYFYFLKLWGYLVVVLLVPLLFS